jgi:lipopolysaccharide biosynthesis glycosyltransferase
MVNICFCSDKNLIRYIKVVIKSIQRSNPLYDFNFHIIRDFEQHEDYDDLVEYIKKFSNLKLTEYKSEWSYEYKGMYHIPSSASMLRILIPELINEDRILYLDVDLVVNIDIKDLYQTNTGETGIAMVKDGMGDGGNTGVMVLNLEKLRENKFTKFCIEQNNKEPDSDGNIINKYVKKKYEILPSKYNVLQYALNARLSKLAKYNDNFIFHFADKNKPWNYSENFKGKNNRRKFHFLWYSAENYIHSE